MLIPYTFNTLANLLSFSWQVMNLKNVDMYTFHEEGGGSEKVYVLYTHLNVDNYGRPLIREIPNFSVTFSDVAGIPNSPVRPPPGASHTTHLVFS